METSITPFDTTTAERPMWLYKTHLHHYGPGSKSTHNRFYTGSPRSINRTRSPSPSGPTSPIPSQPPRDRSSEPVISASQRPMPPPTDGDTGEVVPVHAEEGGGGRARNEQEVRAYEASVPCFPLLLRQGAVLEERKPQFAGGQSHFLNAFAQNLHFEGCRGLTNNMPEWFRNACEGYRDEGRDGNGISVVGEEAFGRARAAHDSILRDMLNGWDIDNDDLIDNRFDDRLETSEHYTSRHRYAYDDPSYKYDIDLNLPPRRSRNHTPIPREHLQHRASQPLCQRPPTPCSGWHFGTLDRTDAPSVQRPRSRSRPWTRGNGQWLISASRFIAELIASEQRREEKRAKRRDETEYIRLRGEEKAWVRRKSKSTAKGKKRTGLGGSGEVSDVKWKDNRRTYKNGRKRSERRVRLL